MQCEIKALILLDSDGSKIYSKYYNCPALQTSSARTLFEHHLHSKTMKVNANNMESEALLIEEYSVVFKLVNDLVLYVLADAEENEILMTALLEAIVEAMETLYRGELQEKAVVDEIELLMLAWDEAVADGVILSCDAETIVENTMMRTDVMPHETRAPSSSERGFMKALGAAKDAIRKGLMK